MNRASDKTVHRDWLRRVVRLLGPARRDLFVGLAAAFSGTLLLVAGPKITQRIVDRSIIGRDGQLTRWLLVFLVVALCRSLLTGARRYFVGRVSIEFEKNTRLAMYTKLRALDRDALEKFPPGQVVSRANGDVSSISQVLAFAPFVLANALQVVLSFLVMVTLSWKLSLVVLVMVPLLVAVSRPARKLQFAASLDVQQRQGAMAAYADEAINGVRVIKGFGREREVIAHFESLARSLYGSRLRTVRVGARVTPLLQVIPQIATVILLLWGGHLAIDRELTIGTFAAFATLLSQLVGPLRTSAILLTILETARAGATRVFELLDTEPNIADAPGATELPPPTSLNGAPQIAVRNVTLRYDKTVVLDDVSFDIHTGETVAFTGRSGSGKSTLALLLARFVEPTEGVVLVHGTNIATATLNSVRGAVGVVFDDSFLFSRSVRENITLARPDASDEEIRRAARLAEAESFIDALPNGFDTVIGEQGLTLSGGQRQRVSLARAFLADPEVLVLDDATSALDPVTEAAVFRNLREHRVGRTTVMVAQRRSTVTQADRVIFLENGRVSDVGTPSELETRAPAFSALLEERRVSDSDDDGSPFVSHGSSFGAAIAPPAPARPGGPMGGGAGIGVGGGGGFPRDIAGSPFAAAMTASASALPKVTDVPPESAAAAVVAAMEPNRTWSVWAAIRAQPTMLALTAVFVILESCTALIAPKFLKQGLEQGVRQSSVSALHRSVMFFALSLVAALAIAYCSALVVGLLGERMLYRLRLRVFGHLQRLGLDFYERELTGRLLTRVTGDVDALGNVLQQGVISLVVNVVTFVILSAFLFQTNARIAIFVILTFPPLVLATLRFRTVSGRAYERVRDRVAVVNGELAETFGGVRVVQSLGGRDRSSHQFTAAVLAHRESRMVAQRQTALYFPFVEFVSAFATLLVLGVGAKIVQRGEMTDGALTAFLLSIALLFGPIQQLTVVLDTWQQAGAALAKLRSLFGEQPSVVNRDSDSWGSRARSQRGAPKIELHGVSFRYKGASRDALVKIDLKIKSGETVALVGTTGAGKSTVMKLIPRFYDTSQGELLIDGVDVRLLPLDEWRHRIGIVVQENVLFTGTLAENVAFARPEASNDEITAALRLVGARSLLENPLGLEMPIARRGSSLSAGQRQLIALARAALVQPDVLLLDEATANLDLETEAEVQRAMGVLAADRTTVVIAHRLETARRADRIVVIEGGRILEQGTHDSLLKHEGRYAELWSASHSL